MADTRLLAANAWPSNAEMIADLANIDNIPKRLRYIWKDRPTFDATYGLGVWWKVWQPDDLTTNDLKLDTGAQHHEDFRETTWGSGIFPQIAYDPPYACHGGRKTSTMTDYNDRYGRLVEETKTIAGLRALMDDGLTEMYRLCEDGGLVYYKCQDFVWNNEVYDGTGLARSHAEKLGFKVQDRFEHLGKAPRPQPSERTKKHPPCKGNGCLDDDCVDGRVASVQGHAARNLSTLFVLVKR